MGSVVAVVAAGSLGTDWPCEAVATGLAGSAIEVAVDWAHLRTRRENSSSLTKSDYFLAVEAELDAPQVADLAWTPR